tara:strand:+ start:519 stop:2360 length:1842 start_codon:yes stop_codon:yes gene_type:complete
MYILGISSYYHDSAAVIIKENDIVAAVQEERFTRIKHDSNFPAKSILYCLEEAKISADKIDNIVFYEKPFLKFERLIETCIAYAPRGFELFKSFMPIWIKDKLFLKKKLIDEIHNILKLDKKVIKNKLLFSQHHLSHAASAFFPSPFNRAAILTLDGVGEWASASISIGNGNRIKMKKEIHFPHSLGLLYSSFTYYLGFRVNSGEYKVMGLAPYGEPKYESLIKDHLINISEDGSFQLDMSYFGYTTGLTMTNDKFHKLFGASPRNPEASLTQREMDIAASIQKVTEDIVIKIAKSIFDETGEQNLCLAGGVALNCVANGLLLRKKIYEKIWIQPAAGDAGGALGAALSAWYIHHNNQREIVEGKDMMKGSYLGPDYTNADIESQLIKCGALYKKLDENKIVEEVVNALIEEKAVGWMQGRMEFGPRALGNRSILADPRSKIMQKQLNLKVKFRESFRPFAPSVLKEDVSGWFDYEKDSPYMLFVSQIKKNKQLELSRDDIKLTGLDKLSVQRSSVPAITHVDLSARIQTVHSDTNRIYHKMISKFKEKTGCPLVINTSFNVRGEPIICSPIDAFKCFMGTDIDILVIGNFLLLKENQKDRLKDNYEKRYELD